MSLWSEQEAYGIDGTNRKSNISIIFRSVVTFIKFEKSILQPMIATFKSIMF